ncbi:MAG: hypothetical protein AAGL24_02095 [Pseudomonadota bacterium]
MSRRRTQKLFAIKDAGPRCGVGTVGCHRPSAVDPQGFPKRHGQTGDMLMPVRTDRMANAFDPELPIEWFADSLVTAGTTGIETKRVWRT